MPAEAGGGVAEGEEGAGEEEVDERSEEQRRADEALRSLASKSHLIGLAFIRADAMNRIGRGATCRRPTHRRLPEAGSAARLDGFPGRV